MHLYRGYTLIEMVLVLTIMSIIGAVALLKMPSSSTYYVQNFANSLRQDLNLTRILSITTNQRYQIVFGSNSYQITNAAGQPIVHPQNGILPIPYPQGMSVSPATTVIFDSLGAPYTSTGALINSQTINLIQNSTTIETIIVTAGTGLIQ